MVASMATGKNTVGISGVYDDIVGLCESVAVAYTTIYSMSIRKSVAVAYTTIWYVYKSVAVAYE